MNELTDYLTRHETFIKQGDTSALIVGRWYWCKTIRENDDEGNRIRWTPLERIGSGWCNGDCWEPRDDEVKEYKLIPLPEELK